VRDNGDVAEVNIGNRGFRSHGSSHQIVCNKMLCEEYAVDGVQGEVPSAVEEVGKVGLPESSLAREQRHSECPPLNSSEQFLT